MIIKILSHACYLKELLSIELAKLGFSAESVDYDRSLIPQIRDADVLINGLGKLDKSIVDACPKLKLVHQVGIGVDNVDIEYCNSKSIYVANVPHSNHVSVAEHTIFLMIYLAKNVKSAAKGIMGRRVINVLGSELVGKTLLVVGLGATGLEVALRAASLGLKVIAITKHPDEKKRMTKNFARLEEIEGSEKLHCFLNRADFVSIHTPLTVETRGLIRFKEFSSMKPSAFLINVARAGIVDKQELYFALSTGKIAGAGFDVFWDEPADPNDTLLGLDNFVLTPHIAGWTKEFVQKSVSTMCKNISLVSRGDRPQNSVNPLILAELKNRH